MGDTLYIIVPCYCEEEVLPYTAERLFEKLNKLIVDCRVSADSKILFVDDGSADKTWEIIEELHKKDGVFTGIRLSRNEGHQNALIAGLSESIKYADVTVTIDADLQDDPDAIEQMVLKYLSGCDIVCGVRESRKTDSLFKRTTAKAFYGFMRLLGADIIPDHADFRLMSRRAVNALLSFGEVNMFLRGTVRLVGFKSDTVTYERAKRKAGKTKYPLRKMISFGLDGVTSFSIRPLRLISAAGVIMCLLSLIAFIWTLISKFCGRAVDGWSSLMLSVWFVGGVIVLCLGVIGEYIGKTYAEAKHRPRYFIEKSLQTDKNTRED